ncbi:hypothetical protein GGR52DRAFT_576358 [Hypoxylon sp. FL1284]|nr:hypothetical protein GGR52DRAFT_576358 [Hypoxylon sp. FL1284]
MSIPIWIEIEILRPVKLLYEQFVSPCGIFRRLVEMCPEELNATKIIFTALDNEQYRGWDYVNAMRMLQTYEAGSASYFCLLGMRLLQSYEVDEWVRDKVTTYYKTLLRWRSSPSTKTGSVSWIRLLQMPRGWLSFNVATLTEQLRRVLDAMGVAVWDAAKLMGSSFIPCQPFVDHTIRHPLFFYSTSTLPGRLEEMTVGSIGSEYHALTGTRYPDCRSREHWVLECATVVKCTLSDRDDEAAR